MSNNQQAPNQPAKDDKSFFDFFKNVSKHDVSLDDVQTTRFMKITGLILLSLLSVFVFVKTINEVKSYSTIGEVPYSPYMITVSGTADVTAVKDVTVLSFTSSAKGATASEAQSKAAESNNKALEFVRSKGVDNKDISTQGYNTYPTYDQKVKPCIIDLPRPAVAPTSDTMTTSVAPAYTPVGPCNSYESVITGYETTQTIEIKIRGINENPGLSGEIITGLGAAGVRVGNLDNRVDKPEILKAQARNEAIAKAREEAKSIARSLGVRLGEVVSFSEDNAGGYPMYERAMLQSASADKAYSPEIPAGEGKISSTVSVTFEIEQ